MAELGDECAGFGFASNAGYPSPAHRAALAELGPTAHHRLSWAYLEELPRWRHLRRTRVPAAGERRSEPGRQLGFDF